MAPYVESIDNNHLLEIGMEGFYGESTRARKQFNPGFEVETDFIANNRVGGVDFATIHLYPDIWLARSNDRVQTAFADKWIQAHKEDSNSVLGKPLLLVEFGKSSRSPNYTVTVRDRYFSNIFNRVYICARTRGPCGGSLFWQVLAPGMGGFSDGYEVILQQKNIHQRSYLSTISSNEFS